MLIDLYIFSNNFVNSAILILDVKIILENIVEYICLPINLELIPNPDTTFFFCCMKYFSYLDFLFLVSILEKNFYLVEIFFLKMI